ncbi:MAG TPA: chitobiase/beta-hexosaminidase C-terminal domain-containing protein, partial [Silvibacterium sp.]|nr:chitobiase/beta-hexosaminidase C-terminal domain-containing protein [Silvibacterium sp.]
MSFAKTVRYALQSTPDRIQHLILSMIVLCGLNVLTCDAQINVTTYHNDIGRTGQNLNETILTTSNVNTTQFGKLFSQPVDGAIYAQPLYLSNVTIAGQQHNVVFVATENDSVYAFDADTNGGANTNSLWQASLLTAAHGAASGATAFPASELCADIVPVVGITGTPVIDPSTNTLYVVSKSLEGGNAVQRLHALDVTTGNEKFNGPAVITATVAGTGNGSVSGQLTFDSMWENQRPGLLLLNGIVYIGFAAHGDNGPWHGWILAYNASTLVRTGAFISSPNGVGAGFWMSGAGLAADQLNPSTQPYGRMFVASGNGDYTATSPYNNTMDYGDSILNLDLTNGVPTVKDEFTPSNQAALDGADQDVASGGVLVLPTQSSGNYPHLLVQTGKYGVTVLVNRDGMGGYNSTDNVVQETSVMARFGNYTTPTFWNGILYYAAGNNPLSSFPLTNGQLATTATSFSSETYAWPGSSPSISANGAAQGIVWTIDSSAYSTSGSGVLAAHNASNVAATLYSSSTNASRDNPGPAVKFTVPTIANGKVYVGTANQVSVYGLLAGAQQAATPVITPGTESFNGSVSVSISDTTSGATIYYTTDGTTPTTSSAKYTGAITVSATETINAVASASGYLVSQMASATFTDITQASMPTFSPVAGIYTAAQSVTISDATSGATIYYTTDGSTPTTSSTKYSGAITVSTTETINAIAVVSGYTNSAVASAAYTIEPLGSGISFPQGFATSQGSMIFNGSTDLDDSRLQLTDGGTAESGTAWYVTPMNIQSFTTNFTFQLSNPAADGITFAIQNLGTTAMGNFGGGLGYQGIPTSVAVKFDLFNNSGEGTDSTGLYTNGTIPTVPSIDLSSTGINLHSDDTMAVQLVYDGTNLTMTITDTVTQASYTTSWGINIPSIVGSNAAYVGFTGGTGGQTSSQKILTWTYIPGAVLPAPTFSVAAGTYTTAQSVTISDSSSGATIYYTTNGTTPTTSSTKYTGTAITVSSTETLEAIAVASGFTNSAMATATYAIAPVLPTPSFSLAAGTYTTSQSVTISDSSSSATIYYTTNGTAPTASSTKYAGGAITVSSTETLEAIAVASGFTNSAVATAAYTISPVLP